MQAFLDGAVHELRRLKELGERAIAQVPPESLGAALDGESNSIAILVQHLAGNMRSRWTDFLTSDGEKPWRRRDREFEAGPGVGAREMLEEWESGWACLFRALAELRPEDLSRTVTVRGEPHTVLEAIQRQLTHYAYHVGQIVLLARHLAGAGWRSLSIPRGESEQFNAAPEAYRGRP